MPFAHLFGPLNVLEAHVWMGISTVRIFFTMHTMTLHIELTWFLFRMVWGQLLGIEGGRFGVGGKIMRGVGDVLGWCNYWGEIGWS